MQIPSGSVIDGRGLALVEVKTMKRAITALSMLEEQLACRPGMAFERGEAPPPDLASVQRRMCLACGFHDGRHHYQCEILRNLTDQDGPQ